MCPVTHTSFLALAVAIVASFIFGYLWYGPLFGKKWAQLMGIKMEKECCGKPPASALLLTLLGTILTVFALAYILHVYNVFCGFGAAALIWLGFYLPLLLSALVWEKKPFQLLILNGGYYFLNLQLIVTILTYVK